MENEVKEEKNKDFLSSTETEKKRTEKKPNLKTKIIFYAVCIAFLFIAGMVVGIRYSFAIQSSVVHLYQIITWLVFILIILAIIAIPIVFKLRKYRKEKEKKR